MPSVRFLIPDNENLRVRMPTMPPATTGYRCFQCGNREESLDTPLAGPGGHYFCHTCFNRDVVRCTHCGGLEYRGSHRALIEAGEEVQLCDNCYRHETTWNCGRFEVNCPTSQKTRSSRSFGIEVETSSCPAYRTLKGNTIFGAKFDCSVSGMEFTSPILCGDEGLTEVEKFCAQADSMDFDTDGDCGLHLHIDMRDESDEALKAVAYAYLKTDAIWRLLVDSFRANDCSYCARPDYRRIDVERATDMSAFCDRWSRYSLCNLNAYTKFGSYEIRLHQGTLDAREICNWTMAHLRFVDWAKDKTLDEIDDAFQGTNASKWESLKAIFGDIDLNRYYGRKRRERLNETARAHANV